MSFFNKVYLKNHERALNAIKDKDPMMLSQSVSIKNDLKYTLSETKEFTSSKNNMKRLKDLLYTVTYSRPDIGYVSGMNLYAGILILNCNNINAFNIMSYLLTLPIISYHLDMDKDALTGYVNILEELMDKQANKIHKHLKSQDYKYMTYINYSRCKFFVDNFSDNTIIKSWDQIIGLEEAGLFHVAIAVFKSLEKEILTKSVDAITIMLKLPSIK